MLMKTSEISETPVLQETNKEVTYNSAQVQDCKQERWNKGKFKKADEQKSLVEMVEGTTEKLEVKKKAAGFSNLYGSISTCY